ncbi:MAG: glycosyltransferase, partial [Armatimonadota bacterium]
MRVLHVVRPAAGGMVRQVASLVVDPRFECLVAAPLKVLKHPDLKPCAVLALEGTPGGIAQLRSAIRVAELVRGSGVQCIHAHGLLRFPTVAIAARLARRPWVATLHNLLPGEIGSVRRRGLRLLLGSAARVLAVSDAVAASAAGVVATSRMEVVRNGIDAAPFLNAPSRTEARAGLGWNVSLPVVLAVSRLAPEKGLDLLGPIARSPKVRVVVAGDG